MAPSFSMYKKLTILKTAVMVAGSLLFQLWQDKD